jgi:hypothetical protein
MRYISPLFIFACITQQCFSSDYLSIGLNDLSAKGIEQSAADLITDRLRSELIKTGFFKLMEHNQMKEILQEQRFQKSDNCDKSTCLVEMGKLLGVKRIISGNVGKIGNLHTISLRMFNVQTGAILHTVNEDCTCPIEEVLSKSTVSIAEKLQLSVLSEQFAKVKLSSVPPGAAVLLDNKNRDVTPFINYMLLPDIYFATGGLC